MELQRQAGTSDIRIDANDPEEWTKLVLPEDHWIVRQTRDMGFLLPRKRIQTTVSLTPGAKQHDERETEYIVDVSPTGYVVRFAFAPTAELVGSMVQKFYGLGPQIDQIIYYTDTSDFSLCLDVHLTRHGEALSRDIRCYAMSETVYRIGNTPVTNSKSTESDRRGFLGKLFARVRPGGDSDRRRQSEHDDDLVERPVHKRRASENQDERPRKRKREDE